MGSEHLTPIHLSLYGKPFVIVENDDHTFLAEGRLVAQRVGDAPMKFGQRVSRTMALAWSGYHCEGCRARTDAARASGVCTVGPSARRGAGGFRRSPGEAYWWAELASRCPLSSAETTGMTSTCWRPHSTPSSSCAPRSPAGADITSVRTRAMRVHRQLWSCGSAAIRRMCGSMARNCARDVRGSGHAAGWSNAPTVVQPVSQATGAI